MVAFSHPPVPLVGEVVNAPAQAASSNWVKRLAFAINQILSGRLNVVLSVTLNANSTTTSIIDARIGVNSVLLFGPMTADAAAIAGSLYISAQNNGSATLTHSNSAKTDCRFNALIMG